MAPRVEKTVCNRQKHGTALTCRFMCNELFRPAFLDFFFFSRLRIMKKFRPRPKEIIYNSSFSKNMRRMNSYIYKLEPIFL
jgi:hypothetical protein